jgi:NADH dehydrogenase FAD-containing subunit
MANVVVVGGGFAGIVAAETLAKKLGDEHQITLVSRSRKFIFYPALVRLAFGECERDEIEFDIRKAMLDRRVRFIEGEVARVHPAEQLIEFAHGDFVGDMHYDFLVLAIGRRLKTELVSGYFENANHLLSVKDAEKFRDAINAFHQGEALIGYCPGARLPVPVFETAFALSRLLEERGERDRCKIKVVSNESIDAMFGGVMMSEALDGLLKSHQIELISNFAITKVRPDSLIASNGRSLSFDLNMIIPPFGGPGPIVGSEFVDADGYVRVRRTMQVRGMERTYAVGDCVSFVGPKMGHMAVRQAEIAAENLCAEMKGKRPSAKYDHEILLVMEADGNESTYLQKDLWRNKPAHIHQSRFWGWAKRKQEQYWKSTHS